MAVHQQISADSLGIDLASHQESQVFRWFLACLLFGKPIQQEIGRQAYFAITDAGITSIRKLAETPWDDLVLLLDQAKYVRYDFSTASKLRNIAHELQATYGRVSHLMKQSKNTDDLEKRLCAFKGVGPVTAAIFSLQVAPHWFAGRETSELEVALEVATVLFHHGFEAYVIGGAVRDLLLGRHPKDFDVATDATPAQIASIEEFGTVHYKDTAQAYGVSRVQYPPHATGKGTEIEIATFRKDIDAHKGRKATRVEFAELEDDVLRRDFTINALALEPELPLVIDLVGGLDDLENRLIRFIGIAAERIQEDPLRIMRAIRFKNQLGFEYHPAARAAIQTAVEQGAIEQIAVDRLRDELTKLLIHPSRRKAFQELDEFGILNRVLPEVTAGKGVDQPPQFHAEGDVWQHELVILNLLPDHPSVRLAWAALLHDIGKGPTRREPHSPDDRIHFDRHYAVGAEMAKTALLRLRFSRRDIAEISWMIYNHMAIDDLPHMRPSHQQRMMGHPAFADLLELHRADAGASWQAGRRNQKPQFRELEQLWEKYQRAKPEERQPSLKRDVGVDGHWLLERFGGKYDLSNGPLIGTVLQELDEWYRDERIQDIRRYETRAEKLLKQHDAVKLP